MLEDWKDRVSWQVYKTRYKQEMSEHKDKIRELAKRAEDRTITLLCKEPESDLHCHRHLLKKLIERNIVK